MEVIYDVPQHNSTAWPWRNITAKVQTTHHLPLCTLLLLILIFVAYADKSILITVAKLILEYVLFKKKNLD